MDRQTYLNKKTFNAPKANSGKSSKKNSSVFFNNSKKRGPIIPMKVRQKPEEELSDAIEDESGEN